MKKTVHFLFVAALLFACCPLKAQTIGIESPIQQKNIFIGFKAGLTAMDMAYTISHHQGSVTDQFVNHSALYSDARQVLSCLAGGITLERTLPYFSYGLELMATGLNAKKAPNDSPRLATQDSALYIHARIPVRMYFLKGRKATPYVFVAPEISTYASTDTLAILNKPINGYSNWNGHEILWGTKYANMLNLNILAGAGVAYRIGIGDYEMWARFEAAYNLGLLNTVPKVINGIDPNAEITRKMRGWEATIGVSFPLFKNPSYQWLM